MNRIGLALSGGGFRATLYHLGVVRYLRDANVLSKVTHITSVSGGSILGAHLVLNWDKYCGTEEEFEEAAAEILHFVQMDVRNRIVRRFPLASAVNVLRRFVRLRPIRQLTRPGLLEQHYQKHLYGDVSLFQLPNQPRLHILATNLSEGCLCSFDKNGLLLQRRTPGQRDRFEQVNLGLGTVPLAVASSSAFPGFFPPIEVNAWDVGADEGAFGHQAFTDGGVYDNLGLRMFRCLEQKVGEMQPLTSDDILDIEAMTSALLAAGTLPEGTPLRKLREILLARDPNLATEDRTEKKFAEDLIHGLWETIRTEELYHDTSFQSIELSDPNAQSLFSHVSTHKRSPEMSDRLWLNRQIVEAAFEQVVGKPCLRPNRNDFDSIIVSDAGASFKVTRESRAGGLLGTALRSNDIIMDRVWQLELESFENAPGVVFIPMIDTVTQSEDPTAPHPEVQRQAARMRVDLDKFSELEITALVQHGYCVARKSLRTQDNDLKAEPVKGAPWKPFADNKKAAAKGAVPLNRLNDSEVALSAARKLRLSANRKIWQTLLDFGDWPTYVWLSFVVLFILTVPYSVYKMRKATIDQQRVLSAVAGTSPIYHKILALLEEGPNLEMEGMTANEVTEMLEPDFTGYEVISDTRIFDLREWSNPNAQQDAAFQHARIRIRRTDEAADNPHLLFQLPSADEDFEIVCHNENLNPKLSRMIQPGSDYLWELDLDFSRVPLGGDVEVVLDEVMASEQIKHGTAEGRFEFSVTASTGLVQMWVLMPTNRAYEGFEIIGYPIDDPGHIEVIEPSTKVELPLGSIATFQLINPKPKYHYECRWRWQ
ncbi:MAG: patatin-like phospholipase family protein [Pirellulales bacterium]